MCVNLCACVHTFMCVCLCVLMSMTYCLLMQVCALCPVTQLFCSDHCKHFSRLACAQTKQKNNFFMIQPCCYCSSSLVTKLSLSPVV